MSFCYKIFNIEIKIATYFINWFWTVLLLWKSILSLYRLVIRLRESELTDWWCRFFLVLNIFGISFWWTVRLEELLLLFFLGSKTNIRSPRILIRDSTSCPSFSCRPLSCFDMNDSLSKDCDTTLDSEEINELESDSSYGLLPSKVLGFAIIFLSVFFWILLQILMSSLFLSCISLTPSWQI